MPLLFFYFTAAHHDVMLLSLSSPACMRGEVETTLPLREIEIERRPTADLLTNYLQIIKYLHFLRQTCGVGLVVRASYVLLTVARNCPRPSLLCLYLRHLVCACMLEHCYIKLHHAFSIMFITMLTFRETNESIPLRSG
jgi:hypothetical protein